jgi:hypothetical protein
MQRPIARISLPDEGPGSFFAVIRALNSAWQLAVHFAVSAGHFCAAIAIMTANMSTHKPILFWAAGCPKHARHAGGSFFPAALSHACFLAASFMASHAIDSAITAAGQGFWPGGGGGPCPHAAFIVARPGDFGSLSIFAAHVGVTLVRALPQPVLGPQVAALGLNFPPAIAGQPHIISMVPIRQLTSTMSAAHAVPVHWQIGGSLNGYFPVLGSFGFSVSWRHFSLVPTFF